MARIRSVDFLPEIYQTPANKKFLNSTLDQLVQEPKLKQTQGYIGRRNAPGRLPTDGYVQEPSDRRTNYQLEPGVIFKDNNGKVVDALSYIGLLDGLQAAGANIDNHDRLFRSETYSWSPFIDFDKFVNYSQYFWLPSGPDSVDVGASDIFLTDDFNVTANEDSYDIEGFDAVNPVITVLRGGSYNFNVNQSGSPFYIQSEPGVNGVLPWAENISSREVLGVTNNGEDDGTIVFNVPLSDAQEFYYNDLTDIGDVDLATFSRMDEIADQLLADVVEIDGIQNLEDKTIVFLDDTPGDAVTLGWVNNGIPLTNQEDRYQIFRIEFEDVLGDIYIRLIPLQLIANLEKFTIQYGAEYSSVDYYKNASGYFERIPLQTASLDTLYYQDASNPDRFGVINVIDQTASAILDVSEIIGSETYTSPNGVVFTNGLKVKFRGETTPAEYSENEYYVEGVGTAIRLVLVSNLRVPESYSESISAPWDINPWDSLGNDGSLDAPISLDYITINRSSQDLNAWSRGNRWFHIDVILKTAEYNNVDVDVDNDNRAKRPIIEFEPDLRLFNYGTYGKGAVDIIDFSESDALSNINGSTGYSIDGYQLGNGSRVIFANDDDLSVRNKIYRVDFVDVDNDTIETINLVEVDEAEEDDVIVITSGLTLQGKAYSYDGLAWIESQAKGSVNQPPLFDIFDTSNYSLSDQTVYSNSSFTGTKLFGYASGTSNDDPILGFPLRYLNIDNLGDIVFENNLYTDTFTYDEDGIQQEVPISTGYVRDYNSRTEYTNRIGWVTSIQESRQAQIFQIEYTGEPVILDITPADDLFKSHDRKMKMFRKSHRNPQPLRCFY